MPTSIKIHDDELITFSEFREFMFENIVPIEEIADFKGEPISKIFPYWRKNELLPFIPKGMHIKISFAELIWLRILDTLRELSYPVEQTKKVCDYFFKDAYDNDLPKRNMKYNHDFLREKKRIGTLDDNEAKTLDHLESFLADEPLLYMLKFDINYLTNLVTNCIKNREERGILIFKDGRVGEWDGLELRTHSRYEIDMLEPHIYLSVRYFLKEFIDSKSLSTIFLPQLLNENERKVLKELKSKNIREISIVVEGGNIKKIKSTKEGVISGAQAAQIKEILGLKNYQQITLDTLNETSFVFKKTNKKV